MPSFLNNAPALFVLEALCLTILCRGLRLSFFLSVVLSELVVLAQIFLAEERWSVRRVFFVLCLCSFCVLGGFYVTSRLDVREMLPQSVSADFLVMESRRWGETRLLLLKDERGSKWITVAKGLLTGAEEGDRFHLHASTRSLREESQRSNFSPFRYWKARGVRGELRDVRDIRTLPKLFSIHTIRQSLRLRIQTLPFICRALTAAVLLGDRDPSISEDFRRWGISHYLAVSGWHVSFAIVLAAIVLNKTRFRFILASLFLWTYCCISGMSASAVRASIMLQVSLFGAACGIQPLEPGFARAKIEPHPDRRVQSMSAVLDTVQGRIRSAWKYTDNGIRYEIETPVQTEIILGNEKRVVEKGRYIFGE